MEPKTLHEIDEVDIRDDVIVETSENIIDGEALAKAIIKNAALGELMFVDPKGRVKTRRG